MLTGNEIRTKFLEYFERNGHKIVHSSPLLPANDPTLLFTNAGMNQFKDVFTGQEKRDYTRATSSQKCIRAGGKHNDLDEVGKTARHHTFFEMLGNFSFGDYFKEDAIKFAWDFLVNELKLEENRLWFSVYEGDAEVPADDEARALWEKVGAKPERILGFGRKDNFWQMGDTGPCGPCSEIHYYMGDDAENAEKNHPKYVNGEGDTTMEIWNLVFMQFERNEISKGVFELTPLPAPSVDTGAGLERMAVVMQGKESNYKIVKTNYDTDLLLPIIEFTANLAKKYYRPEMESGFAMRVIADHARAATFAIADRIFPSGSGNRDSVLQKIMYRAIFKGRNLLDLNDLFFYKVCNFVIDLMKDAYPELEKNRVVINKTVKDTEIRFQRTLRTAEVNLNEVDTGIFYEAQITQEDRVFFGWNLEDEGWDEENEIFDLSKVNPNPVFNKIKWIRSSETNEIIKAEITEPNGVIREIHKEHFPPLAQSKIEKLLNAIPNDYLFGKFDGRKIDINEVIRGLIPLYDTYGTPKDLIKLKLEELGLYLDEETFSEVFEYELANFQKQSDIGKTKQAEKIKPIYAELQNGGVKSKFLGYTETVVENAKVLALVKNDQQVDELNEGEEGLIVLDETPFYAEAGGQMGDSGTLSNSNSSVKVFDTFAPIQGISLHKSKVEKGSLKVGDVVAAKIDDGRRDAIRRNHTGTHLVHSALREVLGTHVKQAGSVVAPDYLRFDFSHYQPISSEEFTEIEDLVAREILKNSRMETKVMSIDEAKKTGAMALFGEKYGSDVRVVYVGDGEFSKELCGGTHVVSTGDIGLFRIVADEAVASGVRRVRAITGLDAIKRFREDEELIAKSLQALKTQRDNLPNAIEKLQEELKRAKRENDELKMKIATGAVGDAASNGDEARDVSGVKVIAKIVDGLDKGGMRHLSDTLMSKIKSGVVILAKTEDDKVSFIVRVSDDLTAKIKAGEIVKNIAPIVGGRGGGKPDMAEGGGTDAGKLNEALEESYKVVSQMTEARA